MNPRKAPVQARSAASVDAILQATVQVLLSVGRDKLTTTRVAERAGVSVGTLYQYFPNKSALLKAALSRHLNDMADAVELVCQQQRGASLQAMGTALVNAFLAAKMREPKTSVAFYAISADLDGLEIRQKTGARFHSAVIGMLATATTPLRRDPQVVSAMLQDVLAGVSRRLLESNDPERQLSDLRHELIFFVRAYLEASSGLPAEVPHLATFPAEIEQSAARHAASNAQSPQRRQA